MPAGEGEKKVPVVFNSTKSRAQNQLKECEATKAFWKDCNTHIKAIDSSVSAKETLRVQVARLSFIYNVGFHVQMAIMDSDILDLPVPNLAKDDRKVIARMIWKRLTADFCSFCLCGGHNVKECASLKNVEKLMNASGYDGVWKLYKMSKT